MSDLPLQEVKTEKKDSAVTALYAETHVKVALDAMKELALDPDQLKHFSYGYY